MDNHTTVVRKVGNSLVMGIPSQLRATLCIESGTRIDLKIEGSKFIATPIYKPRSIEIPENASTQELLKIAVDASNSLAGTPQNEGLMMALSRLQELHK